VDLKHLIFEHPSRPPVRKYLTEKELSDFSML
jgi:hypothetical protein